MAVEPTPRFELPTWEDDTDPISREQFNQAFQNIDDLVANKPAEATGNAMLDAFQVVDQGGVPMLQFSDGQGWNDASISPIEGSDIPLRVNETNPTVPVLEFYNESDDTWYVATSGVDVLPPGEAFVPSGGDTSQVLSKASNVDGDVEWRTVPVPEDEDATFVPSGGTAGQVLTKGSNVSGDVGWEDGGSIDFRFQDNEPTENLQLGTIWVRTNPA